VRVCDGAGARFWGGVIETYLVSVRTFLGRPGAVRISNDMDEAAYSRKVVMVSAMLRSVLSLTAKWVKRRRLRIRGADVPGLKLESTAPPGRRFSFLDLPSLLSSRSVSTTLPRPALLLRPMLFVSRKVK
jgi:hypothetical protein